MSILAMILLVGACCAGAVATVMVVRSQARAPETQDEAAAPHPAEPARYREHEAKAETTATADPAPVDCTASGEKRPLAARHTAGADPHYADDDPNAKEKETYWEWF